MALNELMQLSADFDPVKSYFFSVTHTILYDGPHVHFTRAGPSTL